MYGHTLYRPASLPSSGNPGPVSVLTPLFPFPSGEGCRGGGDARHRSRSDLSCACHHPQPPPLKRRRSEEHTSELQSLMRISYAVFCLKKKNNCNIPSLTHLSCCFCYER